MRALLQKPPVLAALLLAIIQGSLAAPNPDLQRILNTDPSESARLAAFERLIEAGIDAPQLIRSITDVSPRIRATALRVGAPMASHDPELELRLLALAHDKSTEVRVQFLSCLHLLPRANAGTLTIDIVSAGVDSPGFAPKAIIALGERLIPVCIELASLWKDTPANRSFLELAANTIRESGSERDASNLISALAHFPEDGQRWAHVALLHGFFRFQPPKKSPPPKPLHLQSPPADLWILTDSPDSEIRKLANSPNSLVTWEAP